MNLEYFLTNFKWRLDNTCYHKTYILHKEGSHSQDWSVQIGPLHDIIIKERWENRSYQLTEDEREYLLLKIL